MADKRIKNIFTVIDSGGFLKDKGRLAGDNSRDFFDPYANRRHLPVFVRDDEQFFYFYHDPAGQLLSFSESVSHIIGYSAQQCCRHFYDYLTDNPINDTVLSQVQRGLSGQRIAPFEIEIEHKNGLLLRIEITMVPHFDDQSQLKKIESIAHNITYLYNELAAYQRKAILLDETEKIVKMGTWDWDLLTDEVRWSSTFHEILGTDEADNLAGVDSYVRYLSAEDREQLVHGIVKAIKTNAVFEFFHRAVLDDGTVKFLESRGKTLLDSSGLPLRMIGTVRDLTEQVAAQSHLERVYKLINSSVNEIYVLDGKTYLFTFVSDGACRNLGYSQAEMCQKGPFDLCPVIPKAQMIEMISPVVENAEEQVIFEASHLRKDGSTYPVEIRLQQMEHGDTPLFVAIALDISAKKQAEENARSQAALLRSVIDATADLIFFKDEHGYYQGCNKAFERFANRAEHEIIGLNDKTLFSDQGHQGLADEELDLQSLSNGVPRQTWVTYYDGQKALLETLTTSYHDGSGAIAGFVGISRDVTDHWRSEQQLRVQRAAFEHSAHYDALTGLPNRLLFYDRLGQLLNKAKRNGERLALFFIDLDNFKPINDDLGHDVGDKVLVLVAKCLIYCIRQSDTVARLGGDEFVVILSDLKEEQSAALVANKMLQELKQPMAVDDYQLTISASIGISLFPDNADTIDDLIKSADLAMYRVKQESRNAFGFYAQDVNGPVFEESLLEVQLRQALSNSELCLYYQPQISLQDNRMVGIEAFVRWQHPQLGLLLPTQFIPFAEKVGLMQAIDEWVLETACRQMVAWKKQGVGDIRIAVNISSSQLVSSNILQIVQRILACTGCEPQWLELEVTESCFIDNTAQTGSLMQLLTALGILFVIDDFGTGSCSLVHLRQLPVAKLKIDHSFIAAVGHSTDDAAVARAVVSLAKSMGIQVIAEGLETEAQREFLLREHCDEAQGYYYSRPVNAEIMTERLFKPFVKH